jgi:hypothetical protein
MSNSDEDEINFDLWFSLNKDNLKPEIASMFEKSADTINILLMHRKVMNEMIPALIALMGRQFKGFTDEKRSLMRKEIETIAQTVCFYIPFQVFNLIKDQKAGKKVRDIYPDFEDFKNIVNNDNKPYLIEESDRSKYTMFTEERWIKFRDERNAEELEMTKEEAERKSAFINVIQTVLLKYLPEIVDLNRDELIVYLAILTTEYHSYRHQCYHIEHFIDHGFPESYLKLPFKEYMKKVDELNKKESTKEK